MGSEMAREDPHLPGFPLLGNPHPLSMGGTCDLLLIMEYTKDDISMSGSLKILTSILLASLTFAGFDKASQPVRSCPRRGSDSRELRAASGQQPAKNQGPQPSCLQKVRSCQQLSELGSGSFPVQAFRGHPNQFWGAHGSREPR